MNQADKNRIGQETFWMRTVVSLLVLAAVAIPAFAESSASGSLVFANATVIDIRTGHLLRDQTIIATGERITALSSRAKVPANAELVNAAGKFVIPGFWDMHSTVATTQNHYIKTASHDAIAAMRQFSEALMCSTCAPDWGVRSKGSVQ
jgi:predicted amidohydrolase YtcJ